MKWIDDDKRIILSCAQRAGHNTAANVINNLAGTSFTQDNQIPNENAKINGMITGDNDYLKIKFIRNPFNRAASGFFTQWWRKGVKNRDFNAYIEFLANSDITDCNEHFRRQFETLDYCYDYIFKIENLTKTFAMFKDLSIGSANLFYSKNVSGRDYSKMKLYTNPFLRIVRRIYEIDLKIYNYTEPASLPEIRKLRFDKREL